MGSGNPVKKITGGASDLVDSIAKDPVGIATRYGTAAGLNLSAGSASQLGVDTGNRIRQDMRDQAAGQAQTELDRAAAAEARALDASVKDLDPIALERRRRAAVATNRGRSGTILTAGQSLGSADVARKTLLGM